MSKEYNYARATARVGGKQVEAKGKTMAEAQRKLGQKLAAIERGEVGISGKMTVERWLETWLEVYKQPQIGEGHYKNYQMQINKIIVPEIGKMQLKDVKDVHLQKILMGRAGKSKSDLSFTRLVLQAAFKRAYKSKLIATNPAEDLELPAATDGKRRSITPAERKHILAVAEEHRAGLWVKTLLYTGLRPGETRALDWRHVDFDSRLICVRGAVKAGTNDIGPPKSGAGVRDVPIPDALFDSLVAARGEPFEPVFKQLSGRRHTESSLRSMWENFLRELDITMAAKVYRNQIIVSVVAPDLVAYCLRHTYCTDLEEAGVPINVARYLMGHSDISVTAKIYTHTTQQTIMAAADKINSHAQKADSAGKRAGKSV